MEGQRPRVLLVDDEERFRWTMGKLLRRRGYDVEEAGSAHEALVRIQKGDVDVVVLDVKMPGMDGIEALGRIKAIDPLPEVIILTGHANVDAAVEIMRLGGYEYLLKPCPIEDLAAKIDGALEKKRARERLHGGP
jgi:DNA-binding NtrC family response regulator